MHRAIQITTIPIKRDGRLSFLCSLSSLFLYSNSGWRL